MVQSWWPWLLPLLVPSYNVAGVVCATGLGGGTINVGPHLVWPGGSGGGSTGQVSNTLNSVAGDFASVSVGQALIMTSQPPSPPGGLAGAAPMRPAPAAQVRPAPATPVRPAPAVPPAVWVRSQPKDPTGGSARRR